eukprot:TRINITY_DN4602_c1_g2_i2.p6 TRINITY_DN4602_c1_g2~~TRINITY_DN4602_c1_g2_i2.p6  ORF type:complete len:206 (-),score=-8.45 TRINITY_DN4602_c1_g2_i2:274-891(-)
MLVVMIGGFILMERFVQNELNVWILRGYLYLFRSHRIQFQHIYMLVVLQCPMKYLDVVREHIDDNLTRADSKVETLGKFWFREEVFLQTRKCSYFLIPLQRSCVDFIFFFDNFQPSKTSIINENYRGVIDPSYNYEDKYQININSIKFLPKLWQPSPKEGCPILCTLDPLVFIYIFIYICYIHNFQTSKYWHLKFLRPKDRMFSL